MADARVIPSARTMAMAALTALAGAGCAEGTRAGAKAPSERAAADMAFADDAPLARYTSKRLGLSIGLADGASWLIDDHTRAELVARHPASHSTLRVAILRTDAIAGHERCEQLARERALVPDGAPQIVEDEVAITQHDFDTRVRVALQPGAAPDRPLAGHVIAIGGYLRKCFVFAFSTEVAGASDEPVLSSRLAFVRARLLPAFELAHLGSLPRPSPADPEVAPR